MSTPPGSADMLPWASPLLARTWADPACEKMFENAICHRMAVLSPDPTNLSRGAFKGPAFLSATRELPSERVEAYRPIDWHCDFSSGYRWEPSGFYLDARVAPKPGVDIKVPWELSRFVHIGMLARGDLERGGDELVLEILDWMDANPKDTGVNWTSTLVVAVRAINWIWGLRLFEPMVKRYPGALRKIIQGLHDHGVHIEKNLDYYADRTDDHYIGDVVALVYLGAAFPDFPEADRWLLFGLQQMVSEMDRQVYSDGYHHMMSSNYHRFVADLFISGAAMAEKVSPERRARIREAKLSGLPKAKQIALNLSSPGPLLPQAFFQRLSAMVEFTMRLVKPNGLVPQFGDNDSARAHRLFPRQDDDLRDHRHLASALGALLARPDLVAAGGASEMEGRLIAGGISVVEKATIPFSKNKFVLFPDAQIAVLRSESAYLAITCGPNGMLGQGGHGHNDRLSFELNIRGCDVIVDGGCPTYTADPNMRNRYRSTAAHSTLSLDGQEQDPWPPGLSGLFSLPERTRPKLWMESENCAVGEHYGYDVPHRRRFILNEEELVIEDDFDLDLPRKLHFNLDPAMSCELFTEEGLSGCRFRLASGPEIMLRIEGALPPILVEGCFSLGYGVPVPNKKLSAIVIARRITTRLNWGVR